MQAQLHCRKNLQIDEWAIVAPWSHGFLAIELEKLCIFFSTLLITVSVFHLFSLNDPLCSSQARGFINYYGPQRFGSGQSVQSDHVGLALLKEDLVGAADDY